MPIVFDDIERDHDGPARPGETQFGYLNRSNRIEAQRVRALVEDWAARYPAEGLSSLVSRLRSDINSAHFSAFFELALHELLMRTGHVVVAIEPRVPNSRHQPDFLVETPDGNRFYMEAVTSMNESAQAAAADARLNAAIRTVDDADAPFHFLDLEIEGKPARPVTLRRLRAVLAGWIGGLPASADAKKVPPFIYEEHGMKLTISPILRRKPSTRPGRAIGAQSMEPFWGTPGDGIRESVEKKSSRYGALDAPYVVAVNAMGDHQGEEDALDAMLGSPCIVITRYDDGRSEQREERNGDGVWWGKRGPRKRGLSAILSTERLYPWSVGQRRARLIRNPWGACVLPECPLGIDQFNPDDGKFVKIDGASFAELFGLPPNWPED